MRAKKKPAYLHHKATGQARVRIDGRDVYLGPYRSDESFQRYDDEVTAWLRKQSPSQHRMTVDELVLLYLDHASGYYVKDQRPTSEIHDIKAAVRPLVKRFGPTLIRDFGPINLKAVRDDMVGLGWARKTINKQVHRICRMVRWAVAEQHVAPDVYTALKALTALRKGRTTARETKPIKPVPDSVVDATLPYLSPIVADMVRLQRLTAMRPAEVCIVRPMDIHRDGDDWTYRPSSHKTEHHGRERAIPIGPVGQAILRHYLLRASDAYCFSPVESESKRRKAKRSRGTRQPGERYTTASYRRAIERACDKAFPLPKGVDGADADAWRKSHRWAPNRIRHTAATAIRKSHGLEAARLILGHSEVNVTLEYAEADRQKAADVMRVVG